ncbi:MAG: TIM-barrel domain-containing protein, partial [Spirochaeta sp.]
MKQIGILIVSLIIALAGCTTTTENEFIQDIPTSAIIDSRLEISLEDGVVVSIWPTEDGPLRVYAAVGTAPQPDNRSLQLPMQEYLLNTVGSSTVDITTSEELPLQLADHFSRSPGFDFEIDVDTVSYLLGPYAVTPFTGGVIYTLHGDPFLIQRFHNNDGGITKQSIVLDEQLWHGLGGVTSTLDLSASRATIRQRAEYGDQTYLHIPFFFSSGGSSLYYNAATDDTVRFGPRGSGSMTYTSRTPYLDGLIWSTPSPKHSVSSFYELSGSSSLLPRWAFGYIQSKYGYRTQEEVYEVVERFIDEGIPLSSIVLDLYWFEHMGDFTWDTAAFPEPDELTEFLDEQDIRLLTITEPYMTVDSVEYERFKQAGLLVQNNDGEVSTWSSWWTFDSPAGSMIDMAADGTQEILGSHYVEMMRKGIDSFWTDLGEPEEVPPNARFGPYPARDYHNYYNREWS